MINKIKNEVLTYIAVFLVSLLIAIIFLTSAYQNSKSEQTYEVSDHSITQSDRLDANNYDEKVNKTEQKHHHVFAFVK